MSVNVLHGDCLAILPTLAAESFDACVTDPPYEIGFMSRRWDKTGVAFRSETWAEVLRVLKPGAYLLAFGAPRSWHRMVCAIEDAGFEIRDQISNLHDGELGGPLMWVTGMGFPKSHDVSRAIDKAAGAEREIIGTSSRHGGGIAGNGSSYELAPRVPPLTAPATEAARQWQGWGTALKPAWEGITVARKPLIGTVAENVLAHGTGALNIAACRVDAPDGVPEFRNKAGTARNCYSDALHGSQRTGRDTGLGRWPANIITDGSDEVLAAFAKFGDAPGQQRYVGPEHGDRNSVTCYGDYGARPPATPRADSGTAARFFYSAKAGAADRLQSKHVSIKPLSLMRYLCRLITPPGGHVLDCFAGSGTTGMAAMAEGFNATLIEQDAEYVSDIRRRIAHVSGADAPLFAGTAA